jgi:predicted permease
VASALVAAAVVALPLSTASAVSDDVVVSEVYGGGGNSGATYTHDFVELHNLGNATVDLNGWSVQYAPAGSSSWQVTPLTGRIEPGERYLVQEAQGAGGTTSLPTPDAGGSIAMASASGKVALVTTNDKLPCEGDCDTHATVRDFVGYGSANDYETQATRALSNSTSVSRTGDDTDDNAADFTVGTPSPESTGRGVEEPPPPPGVEGLEIHDVQGAGHLSLYDGDTVVEVPGVVTVTRSGGFWMQSENPDGDVATSEGIFVYRPSTVPVVGDRVTVSGVVEEYRPGGGSSDNLTTTEISGSPTVTVVGPGTPEQVIAVVPAGAGVGVMKEQYGRSLRILLAVCVLVLLIACANVANLLLARAVARRGQTAVRLAMGASRRQIVTEALAESVLLAIGGALAGLIVSVAASRLLLSLAFSGASFLPIDTMPSPLVLAFASGLALATGLLFGAAPAWLATRTDPIDALRGAGRTAGDRASFARKALLVVQAALSVVLVAGSTMLARSLGNLEGQDFGFERDGRVLVSVGRPSGEITGARLTALYRDLEGRLSRIPCVQGAGLALYNPLTNNWGELVLIAGKPLPAPGEQTGASWDRVSADYLQQLGVRLMRGRHFTIGDNETAENVAIVNEAFVRRFFTSDEDPLDQHFGLNLPENVNSFRIVGVVGDARFAPFQLDRPARPMFFVPLAQTVDYANEMMKRVETASHYVGGLLLVTNSPPGALESQVARALAEADPNLAVISVRTLQDQVARSFDQQRAVASLAGLFGIIALVLAAIGLYGVTAYSVARRTNEIGLRMALGADRGRVIGLVLGGAFRRVTLGLLLGLPLAVGTGYLLSAQLYGVSFWDPVALGVAAGALALAALVASVVPAVRAAALAPMRALRIE